MWASFLTGDLVTCILQSSAHSHTSFPPLSLCDASNDFMQGTSAELLTSPSARSHLSHCHPIITTTMKGTTLTEYSTFCLSVTLKNWILLVWSKRPFLPVGFSPTPVTKQCHSRTWTWFNPFEILPIEGLNIGNIQSTNSKCLWNKQDFLCSQERAIQKDEQRGAKEKLTHRKGVYRSGGKTWAMFVFAAFFSASLWSTFPLWGYALLKDTVAWLIREWSTLYYPNKFEDWNQWLLTSSLTLIQPTINYKIMSVPWFKLDFWEHLRGHFEVILSIKCIVTSTTSFPCYKNSKESTNRAMAGCLCVYF